MKSDDQVWFAQASGFSPGEHVKIMPEGWRDVVVFSNLDFKIV